MAQLKVWIDQDLCTGDGICVELAPAIFALHEDGLAYVKEVGWSDIYDGAGGEPAYKMATGVATVPKPNVGRHHRSSRGVPRRVHLPGDRRGLTGQRRL